jgi:hypothetical protein
MGWLKPDDVLGKDTFVHPVWQLRAQPALPFRRMKNVGGMKRMPGKRRRALAGDDQNISISPLRGHFR